MSQSERERALRAAAEIAKTQRSGWRLNTSGNMASDLIEKNILALIDQPAALDTPQEPTPAAPAVANARLELTDAVNTTPAAPPDDTLITASRDMLEAVYQADAREELPHEITGELIDRIRAALLAAAPRPALSPDALRQLIAEWRAEARKNIPDDYTKRHLEHKYLKLDNYASGLDDCADVLEDLLRAPAPREGA